MLVKLRILAPPSLRDPILVDDAGLPRYWAAVWASFWPADLAPGTVAKKLNQLESFYQHADSLLGPGTLDNALADFDVDVLAQPWRDISLAFGIHPRLHPQARSVGNLRSGSLPRSHNGVTEILLA